MQPRSHEDYFSHWLQKGMEPILEKAFYEEVLPKVFQNHYTQEELKKIHVEAERKKQNERYFPVQFCFWIMGQLDFIDYWGAVMREQNPL